MPLKKSTSPEAFTANMRAELGAGKSKQQALAIAYSVQKEAAKAAQQKQKPASQKNR